MLNRSSFTVGLLVLLLLGLRFPAPAADFGLLLDPNFQMGGQADGSQPVDFSLVAAPWFSMEAGETVELYFSGGFRVDRQNNWTRVPELYRFELVFQPQRDLRIAAGRTGYRDSLGFIASGLFDGFSLSLGLGENRLFMGSYFTGFLYKKTASITMNSDDTLLYNRPVDYKSARGFGESYFAPARGLFTLGFEAPEASGGELALELIAQTDLTGRAASLHTGYLTARFARYYLDTLRGEYGTALSLVGRGGKPAAMAFAFSAGLQWLPPGSLADELRLGMRVTSGEWSGEFTAFLPVTGISQGNVLRARLSGLLPLELSYTMRPHRTLSLDLSGAYIMRTDTKTYQDETGKLDSGSSSLLLGGEVYGSLVWTPLSDLSLSLGGGAFFPQRGKAYSADAKTIWRLNLGSLISF